MATLLQEESTEFYKTGPLSDNGEAIVFVQVGGDPRLPTIMKAILVDGDLYRQLDEPDVIRVHIEWSGKEQT